MNSDKNFVPAPPLLNHKQEQLPQWMTAPTLEQALIERLRAGGTLDEIKELYRFMREIEHDRNAQAAAADFVAMQAELPAIPKLGEIKGIGPKSQKYMKWETINKLIKPVLTKFRYALNFHFVSETATEITLTAILKHVSGYIEQTTRTLPLDKSGSKNIIQSYGSTQSYAQRYTAIALLNLVAEGEDDDATSEFISDEQIAQLKAELKRLDRSDESYCDWQKIEKIELMPAARFAPALAHLKRLGLKDAPAKS